MATDDLGVPMARPLLDVLSDEATRMVAGTALANVETELSRAIASLERQQAAIWEQGQAVASARRNERATSNISSAQKLHSMRSLEATAQAVRPLVDIQQRVVECRKQKMEVRGRLQNAWTLVESEGLKAHLLDVLDARLRGVDHVAMQNMIDCEQAWLLGKTAVPSRTGGGFHRAGKKLLHETEWLHNLEVRHANVPVRYQGPSVAPPTTPGLRFESGYRGTIASPLWPDTAIAKSKRDASYAVQRPGPVRPATAGARPKC